MFLTCHLDNEDACPQPATPLTMGQYLSFRDAISFARRAHHGQRRLDGRSFLSHPLAVLQILRTASQDLPQEAYFAGLLHDTVEDGKARLVDIHAKFGENVAIAVDVLTRPKRNRKTRACDHEEAYLARMIRANTNLPWILLIKMADRLHNLETAQFLPAEKRAFLFEETAELYLPVFLREAVKQEQFSDAYDFLSSLLQNSIRQRRT